MHSKINHWFVSPTISLGLLAANAFFLGYQVTVSVNGGFHWVRAVLMTLMILACAGCWQTVRAYLPKEGRI